MVPVSIRLPLADAVELDRRAKANGVTATQQARADVQAANGAAAAGEPTRT